MGAAIIGPSPQFLSRISGSIPLIFDTVNYVKYMYAITWWFNFPPLLFSVHASLTLENFYTVRMAKISGK